MRPQHLEDLHRIPKDLEAIDSLSGFNALPEGAVDPSQKTLATFLSRPQQGDLWSRRRDLNSRPTGPKPVALPDCATPSYIFYLSQLRHPKTPPRLALEGLQRRNRIFLHS